MHTLYAWPQTQISFLVFQSVLVHLFRLSVNLMRLFALLGIIDLLVNLLLVLLLLRHGTILVMVLLIIPPFLRVTLMVERIVLSRVGSGPSIPAAVERVILGRKLLVALVIRILIFMLIPLWRESIAPSTLFRSTSATAMIFSSSSVAGPAPLDSPVTVVPVLPISSVSTPFSPPLTRVPLVAARPVANFSAALSTALSVAVK